MKAVDMMKYKEINLPSNHKVKVAVAGHSNSGKTSLIRTYIENTFDDEEEND